MKIFCYIEKFISNLNILAIVEAVVRLRGFDGLWRFNRHWNIVGVELGFIGWMVFVVLDVEGVKWKSCHQFSLGLIHHSAFSLHLLLLLHLRLSQLWNVSIEHVLLALPVSKTVPVRGRFKVEQLLIALDGVGIGDGHWSDWMVHFVLIRVHVHLQLHFILHSDFTSLAVEHNTIFNEFVA